MQFNCTHLMHIIVGRREFTINIWSFHSRLSRSLFTLCWQRICILCMLILTASISCAFADSDKSRPTLILNTTGKEPLSTPEQDGVMDRIAKEAFRRCGYRLVLESLPAERALRHANKGVIDGDLARIEGLEKIYPNLIRVPEKFIDWYFVAFSKQPLDLSEGWQALARHNVAIITGWKIYEKNTPQTASLTKVRNAEQLFTLLARDRTEIALYNRSSGVYLIDKMKLNDVKELTPPLAIREMFIYLNRKHSRLVPRIAKALADMKSDGSYSRILTNVQAKNN